MRVSYRLPETMASWVVSVTSGEEGVRVKAPGHGELKLSRAAWLQMLVDYGALMRITCPAGWASSWDKDHRVVQHDSGSFCNHTEKDTLRGQYPALTAMSQLSKVHKGDVLDTQVWTAQFANKLREEAASVLKALAEARGESKQGW
jgi:hypothetical protein